MIKTNYKNLPDQKINLTSCIIIFMLSATSLVGILNAKLISLCIITSCVILLLLDRLYLAFPFVIFYNSLYGLFLGVSVSRIYTLLAIASFLLKISYKSTMKIKPLIPLVVYALYLIVVMMPIRMLSAVYLFLDIVCCFIIISELVNKTDALKLFFKIYTVLSLISFFTGIVVQNFLDGEYEVYSRFMATFEDPNYMGFFFTIAIFSLVTLKLFDARIRVIIIVSLYIMIFTSLSMTAIVVNAILWLFYLFITKKLRLRILFFIILTILIVISLYNYSLENPDTPIFGDLAARISEKLESASAGNIGDATTGRTDLAKQHWEYYINSSILNIIFGGIPVNSRYLHPDFSAAAHNEYIDMLLNIGIIGTFIMLGYFLSMFYSHLKKYKKTMEDTDLFLVISKVIWACYAMTLTVFLDYRFILFFLV